MKHAQSALDQLLIQLPRKMLSLHGRENITEFVLHELCNNCFKLEKAAYLIDNPDFDCFKGIAGFDQAEAYNASEDLWLNPTLFTDHMKKAPFNQKVRGLSCESLKRRGVSDEEIVKRVSVQLGIEKPSFCNWDMKHDNHGIFVYQDAQTMDIKKNDDFLNGLCLLSFCPVH